MRDRQAGFTLIEVVVTLAVVAILATIALPSFFGESRKSRAASEVQPLFNDLRVRLEQYLQENGVYPPTIGEATLFPTSAPGTQAALNPMPATWSAIKVRISGPDKVVCRYTWATGPANNNGNIGGIASGAAPDGFAFTAPSSIWYYLLAKCDMDKDGANFSYYFSSSVDPTIQVVHQGQ